MGRREGVFLFREFVPSPADPLWDVGRGCFYFVSLFPHRLTPCGTWGGGVLFREFVPSPADPSWDVGRGCLFCELVPSPAEPLWDIGRGCFIL